MRIVKLEDHGQDFTEFHVDRTNTIIDARPFQGWVWKGFRIEQRRIKPGMHVTLTKTGKNPMTLKYAVRSVTTVRSANAGKSRTVTDQREEHQHKRSKH